MSKEKQHKSPMVVLAFRIDKMARAELDRLAAESKIVGIHSGEQFARRIVTNFIEQNSALPSGELQA